MNSMLIYSAHPGWLSQGSSWPCSYCFGANSCSQAEKAMAPHSSTLAWRILWTEGPGGLQSMGSRRVRHDWVTSLSLFTFLYWRRKWRPTHVLAWRIPGTGEPGGLPSMGSHRVGHTWNDLAGATAAAFSQDRDKRKHFRNTSTMKRPHRTMGKLHFSFCP